MSWQIDSAHSEIQFTVRHMMISKVRGRFETFSGTVAYDEANPTNTIVDIAIDTNSINTREGQRDGHLRSPDFFNTELYPAITFQSTQVEQTAENKGKLIGNLTIRDVTKEVALDVTFEGKAQSPWGTTSIGFSATTKINRKDFNLTWNQALETGGVLVGDDVTINIELELVQQAEAQSA
ncbi:MAG: polyisoprenoid-binding protein [Ardenticatenaceae bacterium]|nr:polyisoprenoid-binding protein [Ardenticatenaceae bacterium]